MKSNEELPLPVRIWRVVAAFNLPVLLAGGIAAAAGQVWGGYVLVANVAVQMWAHLIVGGWGYRDAMSRPWPRVEPLTDDDWDD